MQLLLLRGLDQSERREVLAEQQRGRLHGRNGDRHVGQLGEDLQEVVRAQRLRLDAELREQQGLQPGHQIGMEQPAHPGADQRVDLVPGRAVAHQAVRVHVDRRGGEDLADRQGRADLDRLDDELDAVVAESPREPQMALPQRHVVDPGCPEAGVEGRDGLVPGQHAVEAAAQRVEARHRVDGRGGLGDRGVVAEQEQRAVGGLEAARVHRGGQRGDTVESGGGEDARGAHGGAHAAAVSFAACGRRRSRRSSVARCPSIESSASSSTCCGMRFRAAELSDFNVRATEGSNLSIELT